MKSIGIIGCGWLGSKVADRLKANFELHVTTRTPKDAETLSLFVNSTTLISFSDSGVMNIERWKLVHSLDILLVMIPFSIRNSSPYQIKHKMNNLINFIGDFQGQIFFTSSTGVYPKKHKNYSEDDLPIEVNDIEYQIKKSYPQVNILRLGGLMGADRLLRNYNPKDLTSSVNHVHYHDVCSVIIKMIEKEHHKSLYNVVAPLHPSKKEILESQLTNKTEAITKPTGRVILSSKLITELGFAFEYPDPRTFHTYEQA